MAGSLFPFSCPELNVNNSFRVNSTSIAFGGVGTAAPFFMNSSTAVINSVTGRTILTPLSVRVSNGTTFFNNLNSSSLYLESPTISSLLAYNQIDCEEAAKEFHITIGSFSIQNSVGFAFTANLTEMTIGDSVGANIAKITPTMIALKNADTFLSTTALSINNQAVLNSSALVVGAATATTITLKDGSTGSGNGMSIFSETANGMAPATNTLIANTQALYANGSWNPQGLMMVGNGNMTGTPAAPNAKFAEITWANNMGDMLIDGWFLPQSNSAELRAYLFFGGQWVNTGADYDVTWYELRAGAAFGGDDTGGMNDIFLKDTCSNNANKPTHVRIQILEARSTGNVSLLHSSVGAGVSNNFPFTIEGWTNYNSGVSVNSNGVTGIRLYFATGNIASAQWTARALPRRL